MEEILRTLIVSCKGKEKIPATSAQIKLAIEARGKIAMEVQQEIARKSSKVVDLLRSLQVKQLKTLGIQLSSYHDYIEKVRKCMGYRGSNTIIFNLPIDDAGVAIDEAVKTGASRVDGITFNATNEAIDAAKQEALRKATIDAKTKADYGNNLLTSCWFYLNTWKAAIAIAFLLIQYYVMVNPTPEIINH